jgi:hypothetical protein
MFERYTNIKAALRIGAFAIISASPPENLSFDASAHNFPVPGSQSAVIDRCAASLDLHGPSIINVTRSFVVRDVVSAMRFRV